MSYFVITGIVMALILNRNPITIVKNVQFDVPFLMISCLLIQVGLEVFAIQHNQQFPIILFLTFLGMLYGLYRNFNKGGIKWIFSGTIVNVLALVTHQGLMPVSKTAIQIAGIEHLVDFASDSRHQAMEESFFWWLGDWIPFFTPFGENFILSPGDIFIGIGIILFLVQNSTRRGFQQ